MDSYLFQQINQFAFKWFWLDVLGIFFADYFGYILVAVLFLIAFYKLFCAKDFKKYWRTVIFSLLAAILARVAIIPIRLFWSRPRPFPFYEEPAFPSGHAAFYFALSTIVFLYNKKAGILFYIASFLICLARVFIGLHWPSDIIAGALIGILVAFLVRKLSQKF